MVHLKMVYDFLVRFNEIYLWFSFRKRLHRPACIYIYIYIYTYTGCPRVLYTSACEEVETNKLNRKVLYHFTIFAIITEVLNIKIGRKKGALEQLSGPCGNPYRAVAIFSHSTFLRWGLSSDSWSFRSVELPLYRVSLNGLYKLCE